MRLLAWPGSDPAAEVQDDPSLAGRVADMLARWPELRICRAECGQGPALALGRRQVVHLPAGHEAELRLGAPAVRRLRPALDATGQLIAPSGTRTPPEDRTRLAVPAGADPAADAEEWVRIRMDGESDMHLVLALTSVAIAASTDRGPGARPCPRARRMHGYVR